MATRTAKSPQAEYLLMIEDHADKDTLATTVGNLLQGEGISRGTFRYTTRSEIARDGIYFPAISAINRSPANAISDVINEFMRRRSLKRISGPLDRQSLISPAEIAAEQTSSVRGGCRVRNVSIE
jgi:hypothetical protein